MERPSEIAYWIDERPPPLKLALLGLQHAVVICPYLVLVALVVEAAGIRSNQAAPYIGMAMVAVVLHALLQARRWPLIGSGYLCPPIVSAIYLPASLSAASAGGLPLVAGMVMFAAATEMLLSRLVTSLRRVFPAVVSGIILMAVGIELAKIALGIVFDARLAGTASFGPVELIFMVAAGVMVGLSVWGRGPMKLFCVLLGILAGYGLATALGQLSPVLTTNFAAARPFAMPFLAPAGVAFHWDFVFPFLLAGVASGLRTVGVITTCQQMNDSSWSKPDTCSLRGGVLADGLGCALGGLFATPGLSVSPTLAGIQRATGATSRAIVWSLAVWFFLLACLPKLATLIVHMPKPVMAAALFFNGSFMLVGGMEIAFRRPVAIRETFTIGISLILAVGSVIYPGFFKALPAWSQPITASPIAIATIAAVGLNLLFLLGRRRSSQVDLSLDDQPATNRQLNRFVQARAKAWKLPAQESERILRTLEDLTDQILASNANTGPIALSLAYDDYDVTADLTYEGNLVQTRTARFIREPSEEQAFISGLSCFLVDVNADRVDPTCQAGICRLRLVFQI
jgi:NCS2 family nucleobase:cation symporter-2